MVLIHGKLPSISSDSRVELRERCCVTILRIYKSLDWNEQSVDEQGLGEDRLFTVPYFSVRS